MMNEIIEALKGKKAKAKAAAFDVTESPTPAQAPALYQVYRVQRNPALASALPKAEAEARARELSRAGREEYIVRPV